MVRTGNEKTGNQLIHIPVKAGVVMQECTMAAINEDGYALPAYKAANLKVAGCVQRFMDNRVGVSGAVCVQVKRGTYVWKNDGSIKETDILKPCYVSDETTVTITGEGSSKAGIILAVDVDGITVDMM